MKQISTREFIGNCVNPLATIRSLPGFQTMHTNGHTGYCFELHRPSAENYFGKRALSGRRRQEFKESVGDIMQLGSLREKIKIIQSNNFVVRTCSTEM